MFGSVSVYRQTGRPADDASGVGLPTIRERLALMFGDRHEFTLRSQRGEGMHLRLPMR